MSYDLKRNLGLKPTSRWSEAWAFTVSRRFQLGQQFRYWHCRLHHNGEAVVPWFFREGAAFVTNASGSEKLHRILHRLLASGAYGRLLAALRGINGSD
jgi:hypothetical protein